MKPMTMTASTIALQCKRFLFSALEWHLIWLLCLLFCCFRSIILWLRWKHTERTCTCRKQNINSNQKQIEIFQRTCDEFSRKNCYFLFIFAVGLFALFFFELIFPFRIGSITISIVVRNKTWTLRAIFTSKIHFIQLRFSICVFGKSQSVNQRDFSVPPTVAFLLFVDRFHSNRFQSNRLFLLRFAWDIMFFFLSPICCVFYFSFFLVLVAGSFCISRCFCCRWWNVSSIGSIFLFRKQFFCWFRSIEAFVRKGRGKNSETLKAAYSSLHRLNDEKNEWNENEHWRWNKKSVKRSE